MEGFEPSRLSQMLLRHPPATSSGTPANLVRVMGFEPTWLSHLVLSQTPATNSGTPANYQSYLLVNEQNKNPLKSFCALRGFGISY